MQEYVTNGQIREMRMDTTKKSNWKSTSLIAWISLMVALLGGVPGIISIKNDLFKTAIKINYDKNNSFIALLISDKQDRYGKMVIGFNGLQFIASGEDPTTVTNIRFYIKVNKKWIEGKRIELQTNQFGGERSRGLVTGNSIQIITLLKWTDFKDFYGNYYIDPGKTLNCKAAFMFDLSANDIENSNKWKFIATDHLSKEHSTIIDSPQVYSLVKHNIYVFDCHLKKPEDVHELLKDGDLDYIKLQNFLRSKSNHKQP